MPGRSTRFLIDTNLFVAAIKRGKMRSTELLLVLLDGPWELVADDILVSEYQKCAIKFEANAFLKILQSKVVVIEQSEEDILACKPFFPPTDGADIVHVATCLHARAILISNDAHFKRIKEEGLVDVWSISEAIERLLDQERLHQSAGRAGHKEPIVCLGHVMCGSEAAFPSYLASPTGGRGTSTMFPQGAGFNKIRRNEPIFVDTVGIYNGYIADATRIFSLGKLDSELEDAYDAALEIENAIARELRPGRTGRELFELSEAIGEKLGYKDYLGGSPGNKCGFVGHGVGLELDEYPVIGPLDHVIQSNMTVAIEPKMIYPDKGVLGVEDTYLTTQNRAERLTSLPQEIWRV